jgi:hypothetical protein
MSQQIENEMFIVRITDINKTDAGIIENAGIRLMWHDRLPEAQAIMTRNQADRMTSIGIDISVLYPASVNVDPEYHTLDEMWMHIDSLALLYPDLLIIDTLSFSHQYQLPIPMIKISDNPATDEDESVIYYDGMHHAREPIGMDICLEIMDYLSGITGHALNGETGEPLPATIEIVGIDNDLIAPRTCDSLYGRFTRLLMPGTYTVRAFAGNTDTVTVHNVVVTEDTLTVVDFELFPPESIEEQAFQNSSPNLCTKWHVYPNPAAITATFEYLLKNDATVILTIFTNDGQKILELLNERQGKGEHRLQWDAESLPPGLYFYRLSLRGIPLRGKTNRLQQSLIGKLLIAR